MNKKTLALILIALLFVLIYISEISLFFSNETYINASNINAFGFSSSSGDNTQFINLLDNSSWNGTESPGNSWNIFVTFTNVSDFDYIESVIKYNSTTTAPSQHEVNMSIWCVTQNAYVEVEDMSIDLDYHYRSTKFINASHFIIPASNGTVLLQFVHPSAGTGGHRFWIDLLRLVNEPRAEQITINNTISTGGSGSGCTGNCSFDGVWTNSLRKNDTFDSYGDYINLSAPFGKFSITNPIFSMMTLNDGEFYTLHSINSSSGNFSDTFGNPEQIRLTVSNGDASVFTVGQGFSRYSTSGIIYNKNTTHMDYGGANITNLNNTNITGYINITNTTGSPIAERVSLMDGNGVFLYNDNGVLRTQLSTNGIQEWKLRSGTTEVGYILYSTPADGTTNYPGIIFRNATSGERKEIEITKTGFRFRSSGTSSQSANWVEIYNNGSVNMNYYTGTGTDYACFDSNGNLTRQAGPC